MRSPVRDKNYVKVFVLHLLKNINKPLDFNTINDIVLYDGYIEYIDFATCFSELLDDEHIEELKGSDGELDKYRITEKGKSVADALSDSIFDEIRDRSLKSALKLLDFKENGSELLFNVEEINGEEKGYMVRCTIKEKKTDICSVSVRVDTQSRVELIRKNFYERPEIIYRGVLALLSGDVNMIF